MATYTGETPIWQQYEMQRLDRELRYFEHMTQRECPVCGGIWHTYKSLVCPDCASEKRGRAA